MRPARLHRVAAAPRGPAAGGPCARVPGSGEGIHFSAHFALCCWSLFSGICVNTVGFCAEYILVNGDLFCKIKLAKVSPGRLVWRIVTRIEY